MKHFTLLVFLLSVLIFSVMQFKEAEIKEVIKYEPHEVVRYVDRPVEKVVYKTRVIYRDRYAYTGCYQQPYTPRRAQ
jgi:hypothetical protein